MPELTAEQSTLVALQMKVVNEFAFVIDTDYLKAFVKAQREKAVMYDSAAALNRRWTPQKSELMRTYADAVELLAKYIEANKRVTELRAIVRADEAAADELSKIFE